MLAAPVETPLMSCVDDLALFSCQNPHCVDYGKRGHGNLKIDCMYGKSKQVRLLQCRTCRKRFSERKGTLLFGSQITELKIAEMRKYLAASMSVRKIASLLDVNRNTVVRYSSLFRQEAGRQP